ncbi:serine/arginine-rich splicing factor SC35-like [Arachis duranensis]|uniref:Serine/arginine-rich splicing factor SC35-like n=1 Tax=Arachis duranensis TaxID=130453 RepID=A0A6P4C4C5_ARADU|nr:serine/arginine-rich splicing factor SC35-like [Arachis duranensis]
MREREAVRGEYSRGGNTLGIQSTAKDTRIWNRDTYHRLKNSSFSVFVDNLPDDISRRELHHLFCWTGRINDIYLARKRKSGSIYLFAFVRYTTKGGALKAIAEMNHWRLRGKVITVGEAKYRRQSDSLPALAIVVQTKIITRKNVQENRRAVGQCASV